MANQYLARLGILLSVDSAELSKGFSEAAQETKNFNRLVESESKKAIAEITKMRDAIEDYGKEVTMVTKVEREFRDGGRYANLAKNEAVRQSILKEAAAVDALAASQKKANSVKGFGAAPAGGGLTPYQLQALSYQTTDIVTSLAGGQKPWLVLLQQGGQLKDQFGGVTNVFKAFQEVLTPTRVLVGGVAGALGLLAYAAYSGSEQLKKLNNDLALTHYYSGLNAKGFQDLSQSISVKLNQSIGNTKEVLGELVASGKFTNTSIGSVTEVILNMAKLSGKSATDMTKELMPALDGTAKSAKGLNDTYHFLTMAQYKNIELLEQEGKKQAAIKATADALNDSIKKQAQEVSTLGEYWRDATNWFSKYWDKTKTAFSGDSSQVKMLSAAQKIAALSDESNPRNKTKTAQLELQEALKEYEKYANKHIEQTYSMYKAEKDAAAVDAYDRAGGLKRLSELEAENQKRMLDQKIDAALVGATEQEKIEYEAVRKMAYAAIEYQRRVREYGSGLEVQEFKALQEKKDAILKEAEQKHYEMSLQESKKFRDKQLAEELTIKQEKEKLELYQNNILLSDQDLKIAMDRLQMEKNIKDIQNSKMTNEDKQKFIDREKAIQAEKEAVDALGDRLKMIKDIHSSVFSSMGNAVETFVKTGKFAFKDFTKSVILDIIAIAAKAQMLKMFSGFGGLMGSLFSAGTGGGGTTDFLNAGVSYAGIGLHASGGSVTGGSPTIVGERGAELFVPNTSGTIIPAGQFNSGMSGTTINYNGAYIESMSAIDTQSGVQFLMKNKDSVFAANQSASRGLPKSR